MYVDERRVTVTSNKASTSALVQELKSAGLSAVEVALSGRFHWSGHQDDAELLIQFCDKHEDQFHFLHTSKTVLPTRLETSGKYLDTSPPVDGLGARLHKKALRAILLKPARWLNTFSAVLSSHVLTGDDAESSRSKVICFGPERCVSPTIARKLGPSRMIYLSDLDLGSKSLARLAAGLLGGVVNENSHIPAQLADMPDDRIAVVGMSCYVPGGEDLEGFWEVLCNGQSQHVEVPPERFPMATAWRKAEAAGGRRWYGNFIRDHDAFDHKFFKKSPREVASTDPQHRLLLQLAYQAVEQSGYFARPQRVHQDTNNQHVGCYMGVGNVDYDRNIACHPANAYSATGNLRAFNAGKISHYFGWTGPSVTVDTACSSSSVAVHQACRAILHGECDAALAGGVNVLTNADWFYNLAGASFLSPTGQCKSFDAKGDGYCRGEGAGVVFLKKLSTAIAEGDQVIGIVASTRVYQNQNCTAITVPNATSLSDLFVRVVQQARLEPQTVSVVEAHGTGTPVGDPAEYDAIRKVLGGSVRSDVLHLGSVKGSIGHTEFASGVISLIKALLMINKGSIPPQASFTSPSPSLNALPQDRIEIPTRLKPWGAEYRAALINNYGASGSNASMVVTQAPELPVESPATSSVGTVASGNASFPFWLSGLDERSLRSYAARLRHFLLQNTGVSANGSPLFSASNLSFQVFRQSNRSLPQALMLCASSAGDLAHKLKEFENGDVNANDSTTIQHRRAPPPARPVILCFGGQISTLVGLDRDVYNNAAILRRYLDQCDAVCVSLGLESIYPDIFQRTPVADPVKLQTMLFALQYSCAKAWLASGLEGAVAAVVGHSFGELAALCVASAFSLKDALKLVSERARLVRDAWGADKGAMLAVEADLSLVHALLAKASTQVDGGHEVSIACYNGPTTFTLAGPTRAVELTHDLAKTDPDFARTRLKMLNVSNAFHSALVDPLLSGLEAIGREIAVCGEPTIPVERATEYQPADGGSGTITLSLDASFAARHMREPVFFHQAVQRLHKQYPAAIWLEAGSNSTVAAMASRALGAPSDSHFQAINVTSDHSFQLLAETTKRLWTEGLDVSFWPHHAAQVSNYTPLILPPYQFEKSRHWMELLDPPQQVKLVEQPRAEQPAELPKGLTTFIGFKDDDESKAARFRVNTATERFQRPLMANILANTVPVAPGMLHIEVALDALVSLRPELKAEGFHPELRGMAYQRALIVHPALETYLEAASVDDEGLLWQWTLSGVEDYGKGHVSYSSGTIVFRPAEHAQLKDDIDSLFRLGGRKRCLSLLDDKTDEVQVLSGRNIYRALEQVVNYKEIMRNVSKVVARTKDNESAGRVINKMQANTGVTRASVDGHEAPAWMNSILTESFCQVAAIYVNLMTEAADQDIDSDEGQHGSKRTIFVCEKIDRWIRNPRQDDSVAPRQVCDVFAIHHPESTKYVSDVFAFDSRDGSLVEAILGISFQSVPLSKLRETLLSSVSAPTSAVAPNNALQVPVEPGQHLPIKHSAPSVAPPPNLKKQKQDATSRKKKASPPAKPPPGPDITTKTRDIISNLSGLEPEEIQDDSDLVELGIDSLMAMELVREVQAAFNGCTLQNEQLMELTDFKSLVLCIRSTLGLALDDSTGARPSSLEDTDSNSDVSSDSESESGLRNREGPGTPPSPIDAGDQKAIAGVLDASTVLDTFEHVKWQTDEFITKYKLGGYSRNVVPRSTELVIAYLVEAFEQLGCPIRSAAPGQRLKRIPHLPRHERFINMVYALHLDAEARLVDFDGTSIIRTAVAAPTKSPQSLLESLLRDEPVHAAEHKLTAMIGPRFADCLTGKADCLQLMFGTPEGREVVTDMYANSPVTGIWIKQLEYFLERLVSNLSSASAAHPLRILEMGAGTGGTTSKLVPMLARLGVPVEYTVTDISGSLVAAARKRFKAYPFLKYKVVDIESQPDPSLLQSQHIILATNCVHATRNLSISLDNIHRLLRQDGFLMLLEMTEQVPWTDFIFGLVEGWWLFEDDRDYVLQRAEYWDKKLHSVGFGHVDWTQGKLEEASLQRLIIAHASGPRYDRPKPSSPTPGAAPLEDDKVSADDLTARKEVIETIVRKYTEDFRAPAPVEAAANAAADPPADASRSSTGRCVLVTGATGSLGSHIVAELAERPDVHTVVCLNRISTIDANVRQQSSLDMRGISLSEASMSKLKVLETDTSKPFLGFSSPDSETYRCLVGKVTDIVHSAWPMSLTRPVRAYESQFKVFRNLVDFAGAVADHHSRDGHVVGFLFVSSLAVVANYPALTGRAWVPERPTTVESVPEAGYAEAKLACEHILEQTLHRHPARFQPMIVRIAQISGSRGGQQYWNPTEYMPFLIKSAQVLQTLPVLEGTLSWYPVDDVAATLGELLLPPPGGAPAAVMRRQLVYHIDNPARQSWTDMIATLAQALHVPAHKIVPYERWVDRVRRFRGSTSDNPAIQLIGFFEQYFLPMSCGGLILDTTETRQCSRTMQNMEAVGRDLIMKYVEAWKQTGFLHP